MKKHYLFLTMILFALTSVAQQQSCGTEITTESLEHFNRMKYKIEQLENEFLSKSITERTSTLPTSIPIKAHIIRTSIGTGGLSEADLLDALVIVNDNYAAAGLNFFLCEGINYINDSDLYTFEENEEDAMVATYGIDNVLNIYFTDEVRNSSGTRICGYAQFPGGTAPNESILMDNGCTMNGSTLSHEIGHTFGLFHTHGNGSGLTNELVDGSNCAISGDFVCDTNADPQLSTSNISSSCLYTGTAVDANNDPFDPNPRNIMSYSRKECRTEFSPQQYARINAIYQTSRNNLECPSFNANFVADTTQSCENTLTVTFTDMSIGATSWSWDVDGDDVIDYTTQNVTHTYSNPAKYDVALTISNGTNTLNKVKAEYIDVGADEVSTTQIQMTMIFDSYPSETSWQFLDSNGTILYSGSLYSDATDGNTTINETFDVGQNECYTFVVNDSYGDGLCCQGGQGGYTLTADDNTVIASGGVFGYITQENLFTGSLLSTDGFNKDIITLYPNPSNSEIHLLVSNSSIPDRYEVYNTLGQMIKGKAILSENDLKINVKSFKNGVYYIKVKKDNSQVVYSFIKN